MISIRKKSIIFAVIFAAIAPVMWYLFFSNGDMAVIEKKSILREVNMPKNKDLDVSLEFGGRGVDETSLLRRDVRWLKTIILLQSIVHKLESNINQHKTIDRELDILRSIDSGMISAELLAKINPEMSGFTVDAIEVEFGLVLHDLEISSAKKMTAKIIAFMGRYIGFRAVGSISFNDKINQIANQIKQHNYQAALDSLNNLQLNGKKFHNLISILNYFMAVENLKNDINRRIISYLLTDAQ